MCVLVLGWLWQRETLKRERIEILVWTRGYLHGVVLVGVEIEL